MKATTEFRFGELCFDRGILHPKLLGAFNKSGALVAVRLADGTIEWKRQALESPWQFEERVTGDILEMMGLATRAPVDPLAAMMQGARNDNTPHTHRRLHGRSVQR